MILRDFATQHRTRAPRRDECGDLMIVGRRGHIYEHGEQRFGAMVFNTPNTRHWNKYLQEFRKAGAHVIQNGDTEGSVTFDPANAAQVRIALRAIQVYRKRKMTPEAAAKLAAARAKSPLSSLKTYFAAPPIDLSPFDHERDSGSK